MTKPTYRRIHVHLTEEQMRRVDSLVAAGDACTRTELIRTAINSYIDSKRPLIAVPALRECQDAIISKAMFEIGAPK